METHIGNESILEHIFNEENQRENVALARALCPFAEAATDEQILICLGYVESGCNERIIASEIGASLGRIKRLIQSRLSEQIIRCLSKSKLSGVGYAKAIASLIDVASSASYSGPARNAASKAIIEMVEDDNRQKGGGDGDEVDLNTMTLKQLQHYVSGIKRDLSKIPSDISQPPQMIDITPPLPSE